MATLYLELESAIREIVDGATDQSLELRRRLRKLLENATTDNLADGDVRDVIELIRVEEQGDT